MSRERATLRLGGLFIVVLVAMVSVAEKHGFEWPVLPEWGVILMLLAGRVLFYAGYLVFLSLALYGPAVDIVFPAVSCVRQKMG